MSRPVAQTLLAESNAPRPVVLGRLSATRSSPSPRSMNYRVRRHGKYSTHINLLRIREAVDIFALQQGLETILLYNCSRLCLPVLLVAVIAHHVWFS